MSIRERFRSLAQQHGLDLRTIDELQRNGALADHYLCRWYVRVRYADMMKDPAVTISSRTIMSQIAEEVGRSESSVRWMIMQT